MPETEADQPVVTSPYSRKPVSYRTSNNWSYSYTAEVAGDFTIAVSKDISQSPPGRARLVLEITAPQYELRVENATPGRSAPPMVFDLDAAYFPFRKTSTYDRFYANGPPEVTPDVPCRVDKGIWSYKTEYLQNPRPEAGKKNYGGLLCGGPHPGSRSGSVEVPETVADAVINDLAGSPKAILFTLPRPRASILGCDVIFFPDGTVSVGESLRAAKCGDV